MSVVSVKNDLDRLGAALSDYQRTQLPFAAALALNDVANKARDALIAEMPSTFDRPTPFTLKGIGIERANKQTLRAVVFVKPTQAAYLLLEELGGTRAPADTAGGNHNALVVPAPFLALDRFGNIPSGKLKYLTMDAARNKAARQSNAAKRAQRAMDIAKAKAAGRRLPRLLQSLSRDAGVIYLDRTDPRNKSHVGGFFQRSNGHGLRRLVSFVDHASYRPRFNFRKRVSEVAQQSFIGAFKANLAIRLDEAVRNPKR